MRVWAENQPAFGECSVCICSKEWDIVITSFPRNDVRDEKTEIINLFSAGIEVRRQNLTFISQNMTSKVNHSTEWVKYFEFQVGGEWKNILLLLKQFDEYVRSKTHNSKEI